LNERFLFVSSGTGLLPGSMPAGTFPLQAEGRQILRGYRRNAGLVPTVGAPQQNVGSVAFRESEMAVLNRLQELLRVLHRRVMLHLG
jgi:hypothetical protein